MMKNLMWGLAAMGFGWLSGVLMCRYAYSNGGKSLHNDVSRMWHDTERYANNIAERTREQATQMGAQVAEKVSQRAHAVAEKADRVKEQLNGVGVES